MIQFSSPVVELVGIREELGTLVLVVKLEGIEEETHGYLRGVVVKCHRDIHPGYFVVGTATQLHLLKLDLILN